VLVLSFVSLLADVASEMLYPIIPVYLREVGFSVLLIGVLEGVANFAAALTKGYFGQRSDATGLRLPFIRWGYFLSALSKPIMALSVLPLWIFFARTIDRLGKGARTAARDAMLSQNATPETKARVFGFHRSMDTLGAATGPVLALLLLTYFPQNYSLVFLVAGIPGLMSVALIFLLKEKKQAVSTLQRRSFFSFFGYWRLATPPYKKLVTGLLFFALFNSADVFLLIRTKEITGDDRLTIGAYILYNLVFAGVAYPLGSVADRVGIKKVFTGGLLLFAFVYFIFASASSSSLIIAAFVLYGIYAAATEGITKAWITNLAGREHTATAVGFYTSCESICALLASLVAGLLWTAFGSAVTFSVTAAVALIVAAYFILAYSATKKT
jgi:MFS family permease